MNRPPELLKSFANRLAENATSEDVVGAVRMLCLAGLFAPSTDAAEPGRRPIEENGTDLSPGVDRVGIWERRSKDGTHFFTRRTDMIGDWNYWANVGRIEPKRTSRRIVFIGESVARGYLYDPQFTPAMALETILQSRLGKGEAEVIDLARTSLELDGLVELARSAAVLEPDAVVIFAGNNWGLSFTTHADVLGTPDMLCAMATMLREEGVPGLKRYIEQRLAGDVQRLVEEVESFYKARGIPVIWMIPEFNLVDWRDPDTNAPHLPLGANAEWLGYWAKATEALRDGELKTAFESAQKMVELDQGVCVTGLYVLAECSQQSGDLEGARRYFDMARDALIWDPSRMVSPRAYSIEQETLRREVSKHGGELIDLPLIFKEHLNGELPGRRLFLDYCHLTSEGIRVAMAAAASGLLRVLKGADITFSVLMNEVAGPLREVEGEAAFLAAIHNAHWWQSEELVRYYCLRAVQAAPHIAQVMNYFIDVQTRNAPLLMCKSAERIAKLGSALIQQYLLRHSRQYLDPLLLDAVAGALERLQIDVRGRLADLRRQEHSITQKDKNLLDLYYCFASRQPQELRWVLNDQARADLDADYFKAYGDNSRFVFVGEANCPVRLSLVCRLPGDRPEGGTISIEVNGERVSEAIIDGSWKDLNIMVEGKLVRESINEVVVRWPIPAFSSEEALEQAAQDMMNGNYPLLFPIFGEIHRLVASDGRAS